MLSVRAACIARGAFASRRMLLPVTCHRLAHPLSRGYAGKSWPEHTVIDMPALSPTMEQGNVGAWQKSVGDKLSVGDVLVEIETDKATMDFEFQEEGYLAQILVKEGAKDVAVGKPIGVYVEDEADVAAFADFTAEDAGAGPAPAPEEDKAPEPAPEPEKKAEPSPAPPKPSAPPAPEPSTSRVIASPLAKMLALEKGIKLSDIKGTGPNGRIIKRDIEAYKPAPSPAASPAAPAAPAAAGAAAYEDLPISTMRGVIAKRLTESKQTKPDYYVSSTVSVSKLQQLRKSLNDAAPAPDAPGHYKLSVNDILIKAFALAAKRVPEANSHWLEKEQVIRHYLSVDVSVAVATPNGLITPVVKSADTKGLAEISRTVKDLATRARNNKLTPEEFQGGTITISNMGMNSAVSLFTAIINPPQSAIIAVGTVERRAVEDPLAESGISFDDVMTVTGSFDHRVIDGAVGAEYIKAVKTILEDPLQLLL